MEPPIPIITTEIITTNTTAMNTVPNESIKPNAGSE